MKAYKLKKEYLKEYLKSLESFGEVWGPVKKGEIDVYERITDFSQLNLNALRPILPLKKFLIPPRFTTFFYKDGKYENALKEAKRKIIFGVHPCEIHALLILDRLYKERFPDYYYLINRKSTLIIALSCIPDDKCFARSLNTHFVEEGFDLGFTDLEDYYLVWVGSSEGDDLLRLRLDLFEEKITSKDLNHYIEWRKWRDNQYQLNLDLTAMPDIMELSYELEIWNEIGEKCLSCGTCSMVCPTCTCFNILDYLNIADEPGKRERFWDSCMLKTFALVAGGFNFREKRADRVKLWYTHKLKAFITEFGKPACVGCGRCLANCPVNINVLEIVKILKGEEVAKK